MQNNKKQLEICPGRRAYIQGVAQQNKNVAEKSIAPTCVFCDPEILAKNYILREDHECDVREMMNKNPYFDIDQGKHLLIMPISHAEEPSELSSEQVKYQADAVHVLCKKLHDRSFTQEYFTNWGRPAGQSVPHWHSQLKSYELPPCSLPERMKRCSNPRLKTIEESFEETKQILAQDHMLEQDHIVEQTLEETQESRALLLAQIRRAADSMHMLYKDVSLRARAEHFPQQCIIVTVEESFEETKQVWPQDCDHALDMTNKLLVSLAKEKCLCCRILKNKQENEANFVIMEEELEHNYVCLAHYPDLPGELIIVPKKHVSSIKDLSPEEWREHMVIAMALFPHVREYAQQFIRDCGGANLFTKNISGKSSVEKQRRYHVYTRIMPRTTISPTPGTFAGSSSKIDMDPLHAFEYFKARKGELEALLK